MEPQGAFVLLKSTLPFLSETICYDDACHLKKYAANKKRAHFTRTAQRMAHMEMVVDKFHFKNHTDSWCKKNCNPYNAVHLKVSSG